MTLSGSSPFPPLSTRTPSHCAFTIARCVTELSCSLRARGRERMVCGPWIYMIVLQPQATAYTKIDIGPITSQAMIL
jgi:hypothetical protein